MKAESMPKSAMIGVAQLAVTCSSNPSSHNLVMRSKQSPASAVLVKSLSRELFASELLKLRSRELPF